MKHVTHKAILTLLCLSPVGAIADPDIIYWTNGWQTDQGYPGTVNSINRDGSNATILLNNLETVGDIEVDSKNKHIYYNQWARPNNGGSKEVEGIYRSNLDG